MAAPIFGIEDMFLSELIKVQCRQVINMLIEKTRISVQNGAHLYGVIDEYGVLGQNEIFVQITGKPLKIILSSYKTFRCVKNPENRRQSGHCHEISVLAPRRHLKDHVCR
jgi:hypothetical protein